MVNQNIYHKNNLLRQIVLTSFLSYIPVALAHLLKVLNINGLFLPLFPLQAFTPYFIFLPLIIMSFYIPKTLACVGAFLSETLIFCFIAKNKSSYSPIASFSCVLCFVLIPSFLLKKEDSFYKFYLVILFSSTLFQILSWYNVLKYRFKIDLLDIQATNKKKLIDMLQKYFLIRLLVIVIISFMLVLILKKLFPRLDCLKEKQKGENKINILNIDNI